MSFAVLPVFTSTSPLASMVCSSPTFSTAFLAVAVHTPASQLMFCVGLLEIERSACAVEQARTNPNNPRAPVLVVAIEYPPLRPAVIRPQRVSSHTPQTPSTRRRLSCRWQNSKDRPAGDGGVPYGSVHTFCAALSCPLTNGRHHKLDG